MNQKLPETRTKKSPLKDNLSSPIVKKSSKLNLRDSPSRNNSNETQPNQEPMVHVRSELNEDEMDSVAKTIRYANIVKLPDNLHNEGAWSLLDIIDTFRYYTDLIEPELIEVNSTLRAIAFELKNDKDWDTVCNQINDSEYFKIAESPIFAPTEVTFTQALIPCFLNRITEDQFLTMSPNIREDTVELIHKELERKYVDKIIKIKFDKEQIYNSIHNFKHYVSKTDDGNTTLSSLAIWFKAIDGDIVDAIVATPTYLRYKSIKQSRTINLSRKEREKLKEFSIMVYMRSNIHKTYQSTMKFLNDNDFGRNVKYLKLIYSKDNNSFTGHAFVAVDSIDTATRMKKSYPKGNGKEIPLVFFDDPYEKSFGGL